MTNLPFESDFRKASPSHPHLNVCELKPEQPKGNH